MKEVTDMPSLTKFVVGIVLGVAGFAFATMLLVKIPFLAVLYDSSCEIWWTLLFVAIGLLGFYLAKDAGWSKKHKGTKKPR